MTMNNTYTFIAIAVYLMTIAVVHYVLHKRFTDTLAEIETNYRLSLSRACTAFTDAMNAVSKALDTDADAEPEQPTLGEWAETLCKATGCEFITDNGCKRTDEDYDGTCPCDIDGANK
jgi:hypothetical protein